MILEKSMTDYVLEKRNKGKETVAVVLNNIFNYADFLAQPLNIGMFKGDEVLFIGFKIIDKGNFYFIEFDNSAIFLRLLIKSKKTIEDLIPFKLTLTDHAIKKYAL